MKQIFTKRLNRLSLLILLASSALCAHADNFESATEAVANMKVGWNLGNTLESNSGDTLSMWIEANKSRTWQTYETAWGQAVTTQALIKMMKEAGFNTIRVPVTWYPHMEATFNSVKGYNNSEGQWVYTPWLPSQDSIGTQIDADWMQRVKEVVDYVIGEGMYCILNVHHDTGSSNTAWLVADTDVYQKEKHRFEAVWTQIANTFKDYDEHLLFEGYNEMLDVKDSWCFASFNADSHYDKEISTSAYKAINSYAQSFVNAVRATGGNNEERNLIVNTYGGCDGSGTWNTHLQDPLKNLSLPDDPANGHLAIEVHSYPDVKSLDEVKATVDANISNWKNYLQSKGAPVIVGEWGTSTSDAYENYRSNLLEYATYFVQQAKAAGIATIHWMGLSDGTSRSVPEWSQADLKDAIIKGYYGDEDPTAIKAVTTDDDNQSVYSLSGVKVNSNTTLVPGIYIKGGKKILIRR